MEKILINSGMKKYFKMIPGCMCAMFLSVLLSVADASAQRKVQDTFYGVRLGFTHKDVCKSDFVKEVYSDWRYLKGYQRDFSLQKLWLGGRKWEHCDFYFAGNPEVLYKLRFYQPSKDEQVAEDLYGKMLEKLDKKYGGAPGIVREEYGSWEENKKEGVSYTDGEGGVCRLEREYRSSTGGTMYYYVFLYYYNENLEMKLEHSYLEEL